MTIRVQVVLIFQRYEKFFANPKRRWLWAALLNATRCPGMYSIKVLVHYSCNRMWSDTIDESLSSHMFLNQSAKPRVTESLLCGFSQLRGTPYSWYIKCLQCLPSCWSKGSDNLVKSFKSFDPLHIVNSAQTTITFSQQHPLGWINIQGVLF